MKNQKHNYTLITSNPSANPSDANPDIEMTDIKMKSFYDTAKTLLEDVEKEERSQLNTFEAECEYMQMKFGTAAMICMLAEKGYEPAKTFSKARLATSAKLFDEEEALLKLPKYQLNRSRDECQATFLNACVAAIWGYAPAQNRLGVLYRERTIFKLDEDEANDEAARWFKKAADQGNMSACKRLGSMYAKGFSKQLVDRTKAIEYFKKALESKDQEEGFCVGEGAFLLGEQLYYSGHPKNEYMPWLTKANNKGFKDASIFLNALEKGDMVRKRMSKYKIKVKEEEYKKTINNLVRDEGLQGFMSELISSGSDSDSDSGLDADQIDITALHKKNYKKAKKAEKEKRQKENEIKKMQEAIAEKKAREKAAKRIEQQKLYHIEEIKRQDERRQIHALEDKKKKEQEIEENSILSLKMLQNMRGALGSCLNELKKIAPPLKSKCTEVVSLITAGASHLESINQYRFVNSLQCLEEQTDSLLALSIKESGKALCKNIENGIQLCDKLQRKNGKQEKLTQAESIILKGMDTNEVIEALWGTMEDAKKVNVLQEAAKALNEHKLFIIHKYHMLLEKFKLLKEFHANLERLSTQIKGCKASTKHVTTTAQKDHINNIITKIQLKITQFESGKSEPASVKLVIVQENANKPASIVPVEEFKVQAEEAPAENCSANRGQAALESINSESGTESEYESADEFPTVARKPKNDSTTRLLNFIAKKKQKETKKKKELQVSLHQYHEEKTIKDLIAAEGAGRPENLIFSRKGLENNTKKVSPQSPEERSYADHLEQFGEIIKNLKELQKRNPLGIEDTYVLLESFAEVSDLVKNGTKDGAIIKVANCIRNALYKRHVMVLRMIGGTSELLEIAQSWFEFLNTDHIAYFRNEEAVLNHPKVNNRLKGVYELQKSLIIEDSIDVDQYLGIVFTMRAYLDEQPQEIKDQSENAATENVDDAKDKKLMALKFCYAVLQNTIKQLKKASNKKITGGQAAYKLALEQLEPYWGIIQNVGVLARHPITLLRELEHMPPQVIEEIFFPPRSKGHSPAYSDAEEETKGGQDSPVSSKPVIISHKPISMGFPIYQQLATTIAGQGVITELRRMILGLNEDNAAIINDAKDKVMKGIQLSQAIFTPADIRNMLRTIGEISCRASEINTQCVGESSNNIGYQALAQVRECSQALMAILPKDSTTKCLMRM